MSLADILEGAGLGHLVGASIHSWKVHKVMTKKKPRYRRGEASNPPKFVYDAMDNRSPFLQVRYGPDGAPIVPFDRAKAARRRAALSDKDRLWEEVHRPDYWGFHWANQEGEEAGKLTQNASGFWTNKDGLIFPPIQYEADGKVYWALRCCAKGAPSGKTRTYIEGRTKHKNKERFRRSMLFFRSDAMPNFTHLPEFSQAAAYERATRFDEGATYEKTVKEKKSVRRVPGSFGQTEPLRRPIEVDKKKKLYSGVVLRKVYDGVELIGTDRVMAKGQRGDKAPKEINSFAEVPKLINLQGQRESDGRALFLRTEEGEEEEE